MKLRDKLPVRSSDVPALKDYKNYRGPLATDFNHRCGYCGDKDEPRSEHFEIDHFVPQKLDGTRVADYNNLVYACRSCNNSKRAKWPTGDINVPNDGVRGWIDPCSKDYDLQFTRSDLGKIIPITALGQWMHDNLKLWKKQHEILWMYEQLEQISLELESLFHSNGIQECHKDLFIEILLAQKKVLKNLY